MRDEVQGNPEKRGLSPVFLSPSEGSGPPPMRGMGIRAHLFGLVLLASAPMAALVVYNALEAREVAVKEATIRLNTVAMAAAGELENRITGARLLLSALAEAPSVRLAEQPACSGLIGEFVQRAPRQMGLSLTVAARDGSVVCSWTPLTAPINLADREYFKEVLARRDVVVGRPVISRISKTARLPLAHPILNRAGAVERLITAAISLDRLAAQFTASPAPAAATFSIWDERGTVLFRHPDNEKWVGTVHPDAGIVKALAASRGTRTVEAAGLDGVHRVYALAGLDGFPQLGLTISAGISKETLTAEADGALRNGFALLALILAAALAGAWALGEIAIRRRVASVAQAASRIAGGKLETRIGGPYRGGELGQLCRAFDEMAAAMQRQIEHIRRGEEEIRALNAGLERRVAERTSELRDSRERFRVMLESSPDAMVIVNSEGNIELVNSQTEKLFGYARQALIGRSIEVLVPERFRERHAAHRAAYGSAPRVRNINLRLELYGRRKDGSEFPADISLSPVPTPEGLLVFSNIRDITERSENERKLRELNSDLVRRTEEVEAANRELEGFSYSVSHDLRSPLRAIDGFTRILQEDYAEKLDDEGRRLLGVVCGNSRKMGELIDDLLEFSRLGRKPLSATTIDMKRLVEEVTGDLQLPGGKPPRLVVGALPPASGDPTLVRQAWVNLLGNAVKFSGKREQPVIEISGHENGLENIYCVKDNGAGFDMKYRDKLFGVFQRLHSTEEFEGTGVGLAIVQRVVARHGGRVWAEGEVDKGAAFHFSLPRGKQDG